VTAAASDVLDYWFGTTRASIRAEEVPTTASLWFMGGPEIDREITERFGATLAAAERGELDTWAASPEGALALVILFDQFTRNVHRNKAASFAMDARARAVARESIARGDDLQFHPMHRSFFYMPFVHSEDLAEQAFAIEKFQATAADATGECGKRVAVSLDFAFRHQRLIERFGRFPHRNAILGRPSTPEEQAFLTEKAGASPF
jgi:uncharacterized protein (DUF924 family)